MLLFKAVFGCCKTFSGKYIFFGNVNFRKRKMFPCVWLHFKKFSGKYFLVFGKEEGKHKSENISHNLEKKNHQRSQHKIAITARSRHRDRSVIATSRSRSRRWSRRRTGAGARDLGLDLLLSRARALSLSLSHFPEMLWRENRSVKAFPWSKAFFLGQRISI